MNTCKTCKWWGFVKEPSGRFEAYQNARICGCPANAHASINYLGSDFGQPEALTDKYAADKIRPPDAGNILDGSGYWGALFPGPDFGCVHHEPDEPLKQRQPDGG